MITDLKKFLYHAYIGNTNTDKRIRLSYWVGMTVMIFLFTLPYYFSIPLCLLLFISSTIVDAELERKDKND
jgi:hypothetical protein